MRAGLTVFAIWLAGLGAAAQFGKISVTFEALGATYAGVDGVGIGLLVSVVGLVGLIFGTTAGLLVARVGARRALVAALFLGAGVSLVQSLLPAYPLMMAARVLEGVSHLTIVVVGPTIIARVAPVARQGAAMTLWSSFFGVAYAALNWVAPNFQGAEGIAALFRLHGVWMLAMALVLLALLPPDERNPIRARPGGILAAHLAIYASPFIAAPAMGFVCYTVTYVAVLTLLPAVLSPGWGAFAGVAMPLVSILVSLTLGVWLLAQMAAWRLAQAGFAAAILAAFGLWLFWGQGAAEAGFALALAASLGIVQGASFAAIPQLNQAPEARAEAAGAIAQLGNLGTTTGTPLLALLLDRAGASGLVLFLAGFSALGMALHAVQARRRAQTR